MIEMMIRQGSLLSIIRTHVRRPLSYLTPCCHFLTPRAKRSSGERKKSLPQRSQCSTPCSPTVCEFRMAEVKVDPVVFWERCMKLHKTWNVRQSSERPFSPA